jgi:hypothetical protein
MAFQGYGASQATCKGRGWSRPGRARRCPGVSDLRTADSRRCIAPWQEGVVSSPPRRRGPTAKGPSVTRLGRFPRRPSCEFSNASRRLRSSLTMCECGRPAPIDASAGQVGAKDCRCSPRRNCRKCPRGSCAADKLGRGTRLSIRAGTPRGCGRASRATCTASWPGVGVKRAWSGTAPR